MDKQTVFKKEFSRWRCVQRTSQKQSKVVRRFPGDTSRVQVEPEIAVVQTQKVGSAWYRLRTRLILARGAPEPDIGRPIISEARISANLQLSRMIPKGDAGVGVQQCHRIGRRGTNQQSTYLSKAESMTSSARAKIDHSQERSRWSQGEERTTRMRPGDEVLTATKTTTTTTTTTRRARRTHWTSNEAKLKSLVGATG